MKVTLVKAHNAIKCMKHDFSQHLSNFTRIYDSRLLFIVYLKKVYSRVGQNIISLITKYIFNKCVMKSW